MVTIRDSINKLSKFQKITCLILILGFILLLTIGLPTLARYKNRSTLVTAPVWDGSIASGYQKGSGTEAEPYIISNGAELAYFSNQLATNNYENKYFALSNDIVINNGIFNYDTTITYYTTNAIEYILNGQTYYVDAYTNKYYDNSDRSGTEIGTINTFNSLNGFKGHFDGGSFRIYGLYITDENKEELALFTNLEGSIHDLYVENAMVYGGIITAGIASTTNNAHLNNILFDGYVVGKNNIPLKDISIALTSSPINIQNTQTTSYLDLTNNIPFAGSDVTSTRIKGNYVIDGATEAETSIKINGITVTGGSFEVFLSNSIIDNVSVVTSTTSEASVTLTFSNLSYDITYKYGVAGGIVAKSSNTTIENTINKAYIYGYSMSGGLVGVTTGALNINQSYNSDSINSDYYSGGLIGGIEKSSDNIIVSKSYNSGDMSALGSGGLICIIENNTGSVSMNNVFNASNMGWSIGVISNSTVNVTNVYFPNDAAGTIYSNNGTINGNFIPTTIDNLKTKDYIINNLSFNEFISFDDLETNSQNVWVYEESSLPILFVDDLSKPIANIHAGVYSWNNLSYELSTVKLNSNITFSIEDADALRPIKEKYYYISNSRDALTETEIAQISSWTSYSDIVQISEEGIYVIYVKVVDYDDNVTYLNTDLLILDLSGSSVNASVDDSTWTNLRDNLNYVYLDRPKYITVEASDDLSGIASIKYYVTNQILDTNDLNGLNESNWLSYNNSILIDAIGQSVVYIKATDNCGYITYVNTDYIVLNGYTENNLTIGRDASSYLDADPYITNKSTVSLNVSYSAGGSELVNHTHNLMSNILLPMGTNITLIDHITEKVYKYEITTSADIYHFNDSCDPEDVDCVKVAAYPLVLFKEVGAVNHFFTESSYYANGTISENFTIVLDLSETSIETNYNDVSLFMALYNSNGTNVRPTLYNTIKKVNIYAEANSESTNASLYLTTNYSGNEIIYNSDSLTNINITSGLNYKYVNGFKITDTTYENKNIGLSIKLVDSNGNVVNRSHLKNIIFKVGDIEYYPNNDNIVRINLENGITDVTKTLTITTYEHNSSLAEGDYYFKISNYASYDGVYYNQLSDAELSIPVSVSSNNANIEYSFDVMYDDIYRIINKTSGEVQVPFDILQNGPLDNPNIRVSLYKKDQLTAYNQTYSIVDLADYVSNILNSCTTNIYYVSTNPIQYNGTENSYNNFELNLIPSHFENNGYKFVFDLYDGTEKIGTIEKHFIIK